MAEKKDYAGAAGAELGARQAPSGEDTGRGGGGVLRGRIRGGDQHRDRRAEASIGSLYQFFPNKEAILDAVAARYLERLGALYDEELSPEAARLPLLELLDRVIGSLAGFKAENPAFWTISYGSETSGKLASAADGLRSEVVRRLETVFAERAPNLEEEQRKDVDQSYSWRSVTCPRARQPVGSTFRLGTSDRIPEVR